MLEHIANIGDRGARRRKLGGIVWLVLALASLVAMPAMGSPRSLRLALVLPFTLAALGFLQSRAKT